MLIHKLKTVTVFKNIISLKAINHILKKKNLQICEPRTILYSEADAIYSPEMTYFVFKSAKALQMLI